MNDRKTLISTGEHIAAVRRLGDSYTNDEYIEAVELARSGGAGEIYADRVLGVDVEEVLQGVERESEAQAGRVLLGLPEVGRDVQAKADEILRQRRIRPDDASQSEMLDALLAASR